MKKNLNAAGLPIGGPSLMMAFVLLCLTTFAVISYMSALRDFKLSERAAGNVTQFYEADAKAEELLAEFSHVLKHNPSGLEDFCAKNDITIVHENNKVSIEYRVPMKEETFLKVVVKFSKEDYSYKILAWQKVNAHVIEENPVFLDLPAF